MSDPSTRALTHRGQRTWAAFVIAAGPDRRLLAASVGVTTQMLARYLGGSSKIDDGLARRIVEAAGLVVVPVTLTGFTIMTKTPERFDPGLHAHATFTVTLVPLDKPYPANKHRSFGELVKLRGDQPSPPDESQESAFPGKWPDDDLRTAAVALVDELERRGRHEDSEQVARLVTGLGQRQQADDVTDVTPCCGKPFFGDNDSKGCVFFNEHNKVVQCHRCGQAYAFSVVQRVDALVDLEERKAVAAAVVAAAEGVLSDAGFQFVGEGMWCRQGIGEAISAWGGAVWVDSVKSIPTGPLRALAVIADHTEPPPDAEDEDTDVRVSVACSSEPGSDEVIRVSVKKGTN